MEEKQMWWAKLKTNCNLMHFKPFLPYWVGWARKQDMMGRNWAGNGAGKLKPQSPAVRTSLCVSLRLRKWLKWLGLTQKSSLTSFRPWFKGLSHRERNTDSPRLCHVSYSFMSSNKTHGSLFTNHVLNVCHGSLFTNHVLNLTNIHCKTDTWINEHQLC